MRLSTNGGLERALSRFIRSHAGVVVACLVGGLLGAGGVHAADAYTPARYDLSALPAYQPEQMALGVVRIYGTPLESLVGAWASAFRAKQGHVRLNAYLINTSQAFAGLLTDKADIGLMGHRTWHTSLMAFDKAFGYEPLEIRFASGSFDDPEGSTPGLMFVVHKTNPLARLTLEQIDGIFCAQRTGGWDGTKWSSAATRGPEKNIRTWGQLGLTGEWADKPISVYGFSVRYNTATDFADKVLKGSDKWTEKIQAYGNIVNPDGTRYVEADQITDNLAKDKFGIAYNRFRGDKAKVRRLAVAPGASTACVEHTLKNVQNRSYPLFNEQYFYVSVKPGAKMDPLVREFLRYVLSQEGQADIVRDGKYLPLTADVVREQLKKLDQ
jgi:phosphate transport system substrate-binding protein